METSRQQEQQLRRMGREAVTKAIQAANANSGGMRRVTAKVTQVNSDYTLDVDMGDSAYSMPITGLRYTTSCFGVRVGDTVLVDVVGHLATVTGILASGDSGPYVMFDGRYERAVTLWDSTAQPAVAPSTASGRQNLDQYKYLRIYGSTSEWRRCYCEVPKPAVHSYDSAQFTLVAYNGNGGNVWVKYTDYNIAAASSRWTMAPTSWYQVTANGSTSTVNSGIGPSVVRVVGVL